jgi:hypothetical protein
MLKKVLLTASVIVIVFVVGAVNVFAEDTNPALCRVYSEDDEMYAPAYCDGRLNGMDIDQPVAIYYTYEMGTLYDDDGYPYTTDVVTGIQLWAIDSEGVGQIVLNVPLAQLTGSPHVVNASGYTVSYSPAAGTYTVAAPNGYTFTWEA